MYNLCGSNHDSKKTIMIRIAVLIQLFYIIMINLSKLLSSSLQKGKEPEVEIRLSSEGIHPRNEVRFLFREGHYFRVTRQTLVIDLLTLPTRVVHKETAQFQEHDIVRKETNVEKGMSAYYSYTQTHIHALSAHTFLKCFISLVTAIMQNISGMLCNRFIVNGSRIFKCW